MADPRRRKPSVPPGENAIWRPDGDTTVRRRLNREEREALQRRSASHPLLPPLPPAKPKPRTPWQAKAAALVLLVALIAAIGAGRFFTTDRGDPTPSPDGSSLLAVSTVVVNVAPSTPLAPTAAVAAEPASAPARNPAFAGKTICLDPGHGGWDRGYTRDADDAAPAMEEAVYTLKIALDLQDRLRSLGFTAGLTRQADVAVNSAGADVNGDGETYAKLVDNDPAAARRARQIDELQARIDVCNSARADLLLSIHLNGFPSSSVRGYETWFSSARPFINDNKRIASLIFNQLGVQMAAAGYNAHARAVNDDAEANVDAPGDVFDRYIITGPAVPGQIVPSAMPGTIAESLFISNDQDAAFLATPNGADAIAAAMQDAIRTYFSEPPS